MSSKIDLSKLPCADGAAYDSFENQLVPRCHPNTRIGIRKKIMEWLDNSNSKYIFWLSGLAGTGKSTLSRTVAKEFDEHGLLGASFFFRQGEGDRGNAKKFITTIVSQLVEAVPSLISPISEALEKNPNLAYKSMED